MNKYNARKVEIDGRIMDSKTEGDYYIHLKLRQAAGEIRELQLQPQFVLIDQIKRGKRTLSKTVFTLDFAYIENGVPVVADVKGMVGRDFGIRQRLFMLRYPEYKFIIVKRDKELGWKENVWDGVKVVTK